jgi:hypothetical protein
MNQNDELVTDLATAASSSSSAEPEVVQWQCNQLLGNADALEPAHPNSSASATPSSSALDELRVPCRADGRVLQMEQSPP